MTFELIERLNAALDGRYRVEREIGAGGMAHVFLASDLRHQRPVALKVLRPELAEALGAERFLREIEIAAGLIHPNILALYDSGDAEGLLYYVMPYISGESLRERLNRERQLSLEDALRITREIADALTYAHGLGVVHRDIKPENVLCQSGHVFVTDFGIARAITAAGGRLTQTGIVVGSPAYMSPEQSTGEREVDARSDVYSLGCVAYEMLAGEPPYTGATAYALIARRLLDPVPSLRTVREEIPLAVEQALQKALAKVPADRFSSTALFTRALTERPAARPPGPSIAVLPFVNLSADADNEYFADGVTEDVIAQLSKIGALKVISRTSVMRFKSREQNPKDIAARLGVATLLEGSVRRVGDRVRIVAQLIDAGTDQNLWAETYDRQLTDVFAIQSDVALHIARALKAQLTPSERARIQKEPTTNLVAYEQYLLGRQHLVKYTAEGIRQGIVYFEQAIAHDPGYALAYATIALGLVELGETGGLPPEEAYRRAREAGARSLELDPTLGEAYCVRAYLKFVSEFDWAGAEQDFRSAIDLNPNSADTLDVYGRMLTALGRHDEALDAQKRAGELDPLAHRTDVATTLLRAERYDDALQVAMRSVALDPSYDRGHSTLAWSWLLKGMHNEGLAELERAVALAPGSTTWLGQLGQAYALAGRVEQARAVLRQLEDLSGRTFVSPYHFAYVHTGLGEKDRAMDYLERAFEHRSGSIYGIKYSFLFTSLRSHPRFMALLRRMNLG